MLRATKIIFLGFIGVVLVSGCAGQVTFNETARAGDTVIVTAGYKNTFYRDNITVQITPSTGTGAPIILGPNDPSIRAVVNLYPDVLSSLYVSEEIDQDLTPAATSYNYLIRSHYTGGDKDFWQTIAVIDLPPELEPGLTTVEITSLDGGEYHSSTLEVLPGIGSPHSFMADGPYNPLSLTEVQLSAMSRVPHYTVKFTKDSGVPKPHSIQLTLKHAPDADHDGVGRAYVVNPRGDLKNVSWADNGTTLVVMLFPAKDSKPIRMRDFKFYVAGGVINLERVNIEAFDSDGNPINGVSTDITATGMGM